MTDRVGDRAGGRADAGPALSRRVILASSSPRRRDLLDQIGLAVTVVPADVDESVVGHEDPVAYVRRLAIAKAEAAPAEPADVVIGADTTVDVDGRILAKPADETDARRMLGLLSGRTHQVHTGLAIRAGGRTVADVGTTQVTMVPITDALMDWYIGTGEAMGKAGAYAIQGHAAALVDGVQGSTTNVIGLPMELLERLMTGLGLSVAELACTASTTFPANSKD